MEGACTKPLLLLPVIFISAAFPRRASCSFNVPPCLRVLSFPTASLPFFSPRFKPSVLLRGVSQKLKSSFQAPSFCHLHFSTGKMNIGGTKRGEERLQRRLLRARELVLALPAALFPSLAFFAWMLKRHGIKCKPSPTLSWNTSGPLRSCNFAYFFLIFFFFLIRNLHSLCSHQSRWLILHTRRKRMTPPPRPPPPTPERHHSSSGSASKPTTDNKQSVKHD